VKIAAGIISGHALIGLKRLEVAAGALA